jgi:hypothetical protein
VIMGEVRGFEAILVLRLVIRDASSFPP